MISREVKLMAANQSEKKRTENNSATDKARVKVIRPDLSKAKALLDNAKPKLKAVDDNGNTALMALLKVEAEARNSQTEAELIFLAANEMRKLTRSRQVFVLRQKSMRSMSVEGISSLDSVDKNSPLVRWVEKMASRLKKQTDLSAQREFTLPAYCETNDEETDSYPFKEFAWVPFKLKDDTVFGGVLLAREIPWGKSDLVIANRLAATFAHAWAAISGNHRLRSKGRTRKMLVAAAIACIAFIMMIPVPISALAPAEIVPAKPYIVTAPIDGVIDKVLVESNTTVKKDQPLLKFVDVSLRNRLEISNREAVVARAQLKRFSQAAFEDPQAKRQLRTAMSELELKLAESKYASELLAKTIIKAKTNGLVVFKDKNDWVGRPVATGERIMEIANPKRVQIKIEMAIDDAIVVAKGARVKVYLDSDPLNPVEAKVVRAAHEARKTASDVLAYEIMAELKTKPSHPPRLGVRGTAQVFGEKAPMFFYLFRRPLSALRQKLGL